MNKLKELSMITIAALAFLILTGVAKADSHTTTFGDFVSAWISVPGKIVEHVKSEAADIKQYQAENWSEMKKKWPFKQDSSN